MVLPFFLPGWVVGQPGECPLQHRFFQGDHVQSFHMRWRAKEPFNSYSHLVGVILSIIGLVALVVAADGNRRRVVGFAIYGASLVLLYAASTIYHGLHVSPRREDWLRRFDHMAIFVLIAGTYTPLCLVTLRGGWGWSIFAVIWALAAGGIALKLFFDHLPPLPTAAVYVGMGWLAVVAIGPLMRNVPLEGLAWLLAGGWRTRPVGSSTPFGVRIRSPSCSATMACSTSACSPAARSISCSWPRTSCGRVTSIAGGRQTWRGELASPCRDR